MTIFEYRGKEYSLEIPPENIDQARIAIENQLAIELRADRAKQAWEAYQEESLPQHKGKKSPFSFEESFRTPSADALRAGTEAQWANLGNLFGLVDEGEVEQKRLVAEGAFPEHPYATMGGQLLPDLATGFGIGRAAGTTLKVGKGLTSGKTLTEAFKDTLPYGTLELMGLGATAGVVPNLAHRDADIDYLTAVGIPKEKATKLANQSFVLGEIGWSLPLLGRTKFTSAGFGATSNMSLAAGDVATRNLQTTEYPAMQRDPFDPQILLPAGVLGAGIGALLGKSKPVSLPTIDEFMTFFKDENSIHGVPRDASVEALYRARTGADNLDVQQMAGLIETLREKYNPVELKTAWNEMRDLVEVEGNPNTLTGLSKELYTKILGPGLKFLEKHAPQTATTKFVMGGWYPRITAKLLPVKLRKFFGYEVDDTADPTILRSGNTTKVEPNIIQQRGSKQGAMQERGVFALEESTVPARRHVVVMRGDTLLKMVNKKVKGIFLGGTNVSNKQPVQLINLKGFSWLINPKKSGFYEKDNADRTHSTHFKDSAGDNWELVSDTWGKTSIKKNGMEDWLNGRKIEVRAYPEKVDIKLKHATFKEAQTHTRGKYVDDAMIPFAIRLLEVRKSIRHKQFIDQLVSRFGKKVAIGPQDDPFINVPKGFRELKETSRIPETGRFNNEMTVFPERAAEILDDFNKLIPDTFITKTGNVLLRAMFLNPLIHINNELPHFMTTVGFSGMVLHPIEFFSNLEEAATHIKTRSPLYQELARMGAYMNFGKSNHLIEGLVQKNLQSQPAFAKYAKVTGRSIGEAYEDTSKQMNSNMWGVRDVLVTAAILQKLKHSGANLTMPRDALLDISKHLPTYWLPPRVGEKVLGAKASRAFSLFLQNRTWSWFARYKHGMITSFTNTVKDIFAKDPTFKRNIHGLDAAMGMGLLMGFLYPLADSFAKALVGMFTDEFEGGDVHLRRGGVFHLMDAIHKTTTGEKEFIAVVNAMYTMNPILQSMFELALNNALQIERKTIYNTEEDFPAISGDITTYLLSRVPTFGEILKQTYSEEGSIGLWKFLFKNLDIKSKTIEQKYKELSKQRAREKAGEASARRKEIERDLWLPESPSSFGLE